ncbi:hypothetical protein BC830DRAFT_1165519 [Chytriomyces sp. MP71]|nr:hypothetical protein BC830DRAFT_1165519 [Chytriomyces sp. MP71]
MLASFRRLYLNQQHSDIEATAFGHTFKLHFCLAVNGSAGYDTIDLGVSYEVRKEVISDEVTCLAATCAEHKASFMPTEDNETMDDSKSLVDLIMVPNEWNSLSCPFGYEFDREKLQNMDANSVSK